MIGDEFYIGYLDVAPPRTARFVRVAALLLIVIAVVFAAALVVNTEAFEDGRFDYLEDRPFEGVVRERPYPRLELLRPGRSLAGASASRPAATAPSVAASSAYLLVASGKFGAQQYVAGLDGRRVRLRGTPIHKDGRTMLELVDGTLEVLDEVIDDPATPAPFPVPLGRVTLTGEIVDSKCYLGVMKPGRFKTHRACAIRCIRGGIPPVFVVQDEQGDTAALLVAGADGRTLNQDLIHLVAEPVRVTGDVERMGDWLVLRAEPEAFSQL